MMVDLVVEHLTKETLVDVETLEAIAHLKEIMAEHLVLEIMVDLAAEELAALDQVQALEVQVMVDQEDQEYQIQ
jgi:hypothetical protein